MRLTRFSTLVLLLFVMITLVVPAFGEPAATVASVAPAPQVTAVTPSTPPTPAVQVTMSGTLPTLTAITQTTTNSEAPIKGTGEFLSKLDAHIAYISSIRDSSKAGLGLVANYPVFDVTLPKFLGSRKMVFSADAIGFVDTGFAGGIGGSVTIQKLLSGINAGVGYAPNGYRWSWYIGVAQLY